MQIESETEGGGYLFGLKPSSPALTEEKMLSLDFSF
jgi:hypothetical protein